MTPTARRARRPRRRTSRASFNERFWYARRAATSTTWSMASRATTRAAGPTRSSPSRSSTRCSTRSRWAAGADGRSHESLLTPVGLRSLAPADPDYKAKYYGDLRARDAAYHQGTVWAWLIGPFVDAWLKVHPGRRARSARFLDGFGPPPGRGVRRINQRDLRRRAALTPARLHRAGVERGRARSSLGKNFGDPHRKHQIPSREIETK